MVLNHIFAFLCFSAQLLDADILPLVVAISGRVGSETPVNCEFSGLRGVIVEETVHEYPVPLSTNNFLSLRLPYIFQLIFNVVYAFLSRQSNIFLNTTMPVHGSKILL